LIAAVHLFISYNRFTMKNLSFFRVRTLLCLYFFRLLPAHYRILRRRRARLEHAVSRFFAGQSPERVRYYSLLALQCWSLQDPRYRPAVSDDEFATFLDQIEALVKATYRYRRGLLNQTLRRRGPLIKTDAIPQT
jgi:hypothetical protein